MQLIAYGAQDAFLTGNPDITFFKIIYRRHTNFAIESIRQNFNGAPTWGNSASVTIGRHGDLIHKCYIEAKLPGEDIKYIESVGHVFIKEVELEIGGQKIDTHYGEWLEIWSELTLPAEKSSGYDRMVGKTSSHLDAGMMTSGNSMFIPLQFFFCRNPGLALPLVALQYHDVKLNFKFNDFDKCIAAAISPTPKIDPVLWIDYIYLDTDERKRFAQTSHNMLIDQLQINKTSNKKLDLTFNHPCKELVWVLQSNSPRTADDNNNYGFNFLCNSKHEQDGPIKSAVLKINGMERFDKRCGAYFKLVQPFQHHTRVPEKSIYCYSFALHPEEQQPSGTCNFSRIDNTQFVIEKHTDNGTNEVSGELHVYAINYNILRIQSGMAGVAFSN